MMAAEKPAKEAVKERRPAPVTRVRNRGVISGSLERFADAYREQFPDRDVRYVYDPTHKPELSGVMGRMAAGYRKVTFGELGLELEGIEEGSQVRVGDLVLMSIGKKEKEALRAEREGWAKDKAKSVQREFYQNVNEAAETSTPSHHSGPATRPMGRAVIEEREFSYDIEQRRGE